MIQSLIPATVPIAPTAISIIPAPNSARPTPIFTNILPIPAAVRTIATITIAAKPITIATKNVNAVMRIPAIAARRPIATGTITGHPIRMIATIRIIFNHLFVHGLFSCSIGIPAFSSSGSSLSALIFAATFSGLSSSSITFFSFSAPASSK